MARGSFRNFLNKSLSTFGVKSWASPSYGVTGVEKHGSDYFYPLNLRHFLSGSGLTESDFQKSLIAFSMLGKFAHMCSHTKWLGYDKADNLIEADPFYDLMARPNLIQTAGQYYFSHIVQSKMTGAAHSNVLVGDNFKYDLTKYQLLVLPGLDFGTGHDMRDMLIKGDFDDTSALYTSNKGDRTKIPYNDLIEFVDVTQSSKDPFKYLSTCAAACRVIANNELRLEADNILTGKPGGLGLLTRKSSIGVDGIPMPMGKDEKGDIEDRLQHSYGVGKGKSSIIATNGDFRFLEFAQSIKDFDLDKGYERDLSQFANALDLSPNLFKAGVKYENQKQVQIEAYQGPVKSYMKNLGDSHLNKVKEYTKIVRLEPSFDHLPVMFENKKQYASYLNSMLDALTKAKNLGLDDKTIQEQLSQLI